MSLQFCVLSSGSRANCSVVRTAQSSVMIDCGLALRTTEQRMRFVGFEPNGIQAIVVSHEHSDHLKGVRFFKNRYNVPVYMNRKTAAAAEFLDGEFVPFETGSRFTIGDLTFLPVEVSHDAAEPVAFRIDGESRAMAIVTDLGVVTPQVEQMFPGLDALVLESNHDKEMLYRGPYPWHIKQRILSRLGHISNCTAGSLVEQIVCSRELKLKTIVGAHISEKNNTPELVRDALSAAVVKVMSDESCRPEVLVAGAQMPTRWIVLE